MQRQQHPISFPTVKKTRCGQKLLHFPSDVCARWGGLRLPSIDFPRMAPSPDGPLGGTSSLSEGPLIGRCQSVPSPAHLASFVSCFFQVEELMPASYSAFSDDSLGCGRGANGLLLIGRAAHEPSLFPEILGGRVNHLMSFFLMEGTRAMRAEDMHPLPSALQKGCRCHAAVHRELRPACQGLEQPVIFSKGKNLDNQQTCAYHGLNP